MADRIPNHIAFIMDGNGRWARKRGLPRAKGHERGAETIRVMLDALGTLGIGEATFYALSSENFKNRPEKEIARLIELLNRYIQKERASLVEKGIQLRVIGRINKLPARSQKLLNEAVEATAVNAKLIFRVAINYGSRQEILDAARALARACKDGSVSDHALASLNENTFRRFLYDPEMTDPDLLIRTGGLSRISNFLLWQLSYTELYITSTLWPAFRKQHLEKALDVYAGTARKFGAL